MHKLNRKVSNILHNFDFFGHPITVNYRGNDKYQTSFGSLVSIICFALMLAFSLFKFKTMVNRDDT